MVESIKYHTSSTGSMTNTELMNTNANKTMKSSSARLFRSIGMKGSLPIGQPEYQGLDNTVKKFLGKFASFARAWAVLSWWFKWLRLAPLRHKSLHSLRFETYTATCKGVSPLSFRALTSLPRLSKKFTEVIYC